MQEKNYYLTLKVPIFPALHFFTAVLDAVEEKYAAIRLNRLAVLFEMDEEMMYEV